MDTSAPRGTPAAPRPRRPGNRPVAFLLSSVGYATTARFRDRLRPLDLDPRQYAVLRTIGAAGGRPQHAIGDILQIPRSRMVALTDTLERRGLIERRPDPGDRRIRTLHLTPDGNDTLEQATRIAIDFDTEVCAGLTPQQRTHLAELLTQLAATLDLTPTAHASSRQTTPGWPST